MSVVLEVTGGVELIVEFFTGLLGIGSVMKESKDGGAVV